MNPQTITYGNGDGDQVTRLEDTNTFLMSGAQLFWGVGQWPPTIFVNGIEKIRTKFDFYKVYKNKYKETMHCEYRSVHGDEFKLIIHND